MAVHTYTRDAAMTLRDRILSVLNADPITALEIAVVLRERDAHRVQAVLDAELGEGRISRRWRDLEDETYAWGRYLDFRGTPEHRLQVGYIAFQG